MSTARYRIHGSARAAETSTQAAGELVSIRHVNSLTPGRARDGVSGEVDVAGDEVVRIVLDDDFILWGRVDDIVREYGRQAISRDGGRAVEFDRLVPMRVRAGGAQAERGVFGMVVKALEFFGVSLKKDAAGKLGVWFEDKLFGDHPPALYRCPLDDGFALSRLPATQSIGAAKKPVLVFIHGTASSAEGSFGKLWDGAEAKAVRDKLKEIYDDRVYAFQHRTLTESPIDNALELLKRIEPGADVHLVSHSRGGMVGELLCLSGCAGLSRALPDNVIDELFKTDRTLAEQIGLSPLDAEAKKKRDEAYDADKARLKQLIALLEQRKISVNRFVRVACPARGTTLASGRLDRWFSMLNFVAQKATGDGLFGDSLDFILGITKERTDPRTLPGLEAMMPGSALTRLLQHPELKTKSDLSVIAGDIEGESIWGRLKLLAADWFYNSDHDLVVNTGSMFGGLRRDAVSARFLQDKGASVSHFSYFANERSVDWLLKGLAREDGDSGGFAPLAEAKHEAPRWREAVARSRESATPRPIAIVLPGIMGSALEVRASSVWLNYLAIAVGRLDLLRYGSKDVAAVDLLTDFYGPLLEFLAATHRVEILPYDWRLSVTAAAEKLADLLELQLREAERTRQPVHIVAHSMGGLVVRSMIASDRGSKLWQRCRALPNSRFMMLGTPNRGSYEAVRWLTGNNPTQTKLELVDFAHDMDELIDIVREFPGLLELLPFDQASPDFAQSALWTKLKNDLTASWNTADSRALLGARSIWNLLKTSPVDGAHMVYIAGCQNLTVSGYQIVNDDSLFARGRKRLQFLAVRQGDGTVTWLSGQLPGVQTWYVDNTAHDALCTQRNAFPAYLDLLMTGLTTRLPKAPPERLRAATEEPEEFPLPLIPPTDDIPGPEDLREFSFGISAPAPPTRDQALPFVSVSICHGDLAYARHPVLVGHYWGDTVVSAEAVLDERLDHALRRRQQLGLYPGYLGTHAVFLARDPFSRPKGGIVVGLGQVGDLSSTSLQTGVRDALLEYAYEVLQCRDNRFGDEGTTRSASVSCLLVGTGASGISVRESVEAILRGVLDANARLDAAKMIGQTRIDRVEILELYEDIALTAAEALGQILSDSDIGNRVVWDPRILESGQGKRYRLRNVEPAGWWNRLEIVEEKIDKKWMGLRFVASTERARAEITQAVGQLRLAESFIVRASSSAASNSDVAKTLFEMLLPNRLKELAPRSSNLILLVDDTSARYPWELLEDRWSVNGRPPAITAGMVRQLKTLTFRPRPAHTIQSTALIVGDPKLDGSLDFSDLPGAREEAQSVADLLNANGYNVKRCIGDEASRIVESLHENGWRILHLAGHGVHDFPISEETSDDEIPEVNKKTRRLSGMVIGNNVFLTPGDVEQMRWTPELVFINCCHLGRTQSEGRSNFPALAANLGVQFIKMGVKVVIAAGWAVEDSAASSFARSFYTRMLQGETFGEAVRAAREAIWYANPGVNTWGAYQCYGDPGFRLKINKEGQAARKERRYYSPAELIADLENLAESIRVDANRIKSEVELHRERGDRLLALIDRIPEIKHDEWLAAADVAAAIGFAWGEIGVFGEAIAWLEKALAAERSDCSLRVVEQLANFKAKNAVAQWLSDRATAPKDLEARREKHVQTIESSIRELKDLCDRFETEERLTLLGSASKRLAILKATREQQRAALASAARYYNRAFEAKKRTKAYGFTNWATMELLAEQLGAKPAFEESHESAVLQEAARLADTLSKNNEKEPNFWDAASLADIDLLRLLIAFRPEKPATPERAALARRRKAKSGSTRLPPNVSANTRDELRNSIRDSIVACYRRAIERGASPRETGSVRENLDILIEIIAKRNTPLTNALRHVRESLSRKDA